MKCRTIPPIYLTLAFLLVYFVLAIAFPVFRVITMAGTFVLLVAAFGAFFYIIRTRIRVAYGSIEIVVALIATFLLISDQPGIDFFVRWLGGVYIVVRGLDNIAAGLKPEPRKKWDHIFGFHKLENNR